MISRRSFFIIGVLVTNVLYFILWAKRSCVCHLSAYARAHKRLHCGHVNMFKWQMMSARKKRQGGGALRAHHELMNRCFCHSPGANVSTSLLLAVRGLTHDLQTEQYFATNASKWTKWRIISHDFFSHFSHCHQMFWGLHFLRRFLVRCCLVPKHRKASTRHNKIKHMTTLESRSAFQLLNALLQFQLQYIGAL